MIRRVLECETCQKQFDIPDLDLSRAYDYRLPEDWFTLVEGNPQLKTGWHFCADECLHKWLLARLCKETEGNKA